MSFWGNSFIFDGIPSEVHSLTISTPDGGESTNPGSNDVELLTEEVYKKSRTYLLGVKHSSPLEFDITFTSERELSSVDLTLIQKWLFGHSMYKKLQIVQADMDNVYFNCFLKNPTVYKVGNKIQGINATVLCDAPWGWTFEKTLSNDYVIANVNDVIVFNNTSDDNDYLYPEIEFTMNSTGGDLTIENQNDDNRQFVFTGLSADEVMTIDNDRNIISSSTGLRRLSTFNKKWFRFAPELNTLAVSGNISNLTFTYQLARKLSG